MVHAEASQAFVGSPAGAAPAVRSWIRVRRRALITSAAVAVAALAVYSAVELARFRRIDQELRTYIYTAPTGPASRPEFLAYLRRSNTEIYRPVSVEKLPKSVKGAVLAAEDHRFYSHPGVDPIGIARAAWVNVRSLKIRQGGSTITQQLIRLRLLDARRTVARKLREVWLALVLERFWSKEAILEAYLNEVYLGSRHGQAVRGIGAAARAYLGKDVGGLGLAEAALLAGMIQAPNRYSPEQFVERAAGRRNVVLSRMRELGMIAEAATKVAGLEPIRVRAWRAPPAIASHFSDMTREAVRRDLSKRIAAGAGPVAIMTSLDPRLQRLAEAAVSRGLAALEEQMPRLWRSEPKERLQAVLVALDPPTGEIRVLVGGREYPASQFNRAVYARRQAGSAFKPFVYAAALTGTAPRFAPNSVVSDSPILVKTAGGLWRPRNYANHYEGPVTVRRALVASLNAATVRVGLDIGLAEVSRTAHRLGIESPVGDGLAALLGAVEVTPLELARSYLPFASGGLRPGKPSLVTAIRVDGKTVAAERPPVIRVLAPAEATLMTLLLQDVIHDGTAVRARGLAVREGAAGKTGTTNEGRDAWFVGYTSNLLTLVWVGFDNGEPHGLSGAEAALPIWVDFMRRAH